MIDTERSVRYSGNDQNNLNSICFSVKIEHFVWADGEKSGSVQKIFNGRSLFLLGCQLFWQ
jgi:hypothetical protein